MELNYLGYKVSGIYKITNKVTKDFYIGSSKGMRFRIYKHKSKLLNGNHPNKHLQSSFNKHKIENFKVEVIEYCDLNKLIKSEQYWIDTLKPKYNKCKIAGNTIGYKHTQEYLDKRRKPIIQLDLQGNFIAEYSCARIAGEILNFNGDSINCCTRGKGSYTYKKYIFLFKKDYINKTKEKILFERIETKRNNLSRGRHIREIKKLNTTKTQ